MNDEERWLLKEKYGGEKTEAFFADCERLKLGEPLAYLIGTVPFFHTVIALDSRPLIPRPETEYWAERAIQRIIESRQHSPRVLDLCAGSGCIGIAVAVAIPNTHVDFVEIDPTHHSTIAKNLVLNHIDITRTDIMGGDLFECVGARYDYILSNPPYIDPEHNRSTTSVRTYEPALALYGGGAGLAIISRIIAEAPFHLVQHGELWIEHEPEQVDEIRDFAMTQGFVVHTQLDQYRVPRFSRLVLQ